VEHAGSHHEEVLRCHAGDDDPLGESLGGESDSIDSTFGSHCVDGDSIGSTFGGTFESDCQGSQYIGSTRVGQG
jgi:hypothetical protein